MDQPTLYLLVGYPGAGKTTVSKIIHEQTGAVHLWADHERNQRFPNPSHTHEENLQLYAQLNRETQALLHAGKSVIFDTNFNFFKDREHLRRIAADEGARSVVMWITTAKALARARATVHGDGQHTRIWGNMTVADFERISSHLEPPRAEERPIIKIDGTHITPEVIARALEGIAS